MPGTNDEAILTLPEPESEEGKFWRQLWQEERDKRLSLVDVLRKEEKLLGEARAGIDNQTEKVALRMLQWSLARIVGRWAHGSTYKFGHRNGRPTFIEGGSPGEDEEFKE